MVIRLISEIRSFKIYHCIVSLSSESSAGPVEVARVERFGAKLVRTVVVWLVVAFGEFARAMLSHEANNECLRSWLVVT